MTSALAPVDRPAIRPLRKMSDGFYHSADGRWRFQRDDEGYAPSEDDRGVRPGRRWFVYHEERDVQDTADTLREAVAFAAHVENQIAVARASRSGEGGSA